MYNFEYIPTHPERSATPAELTVAPVSPEITATSASVLGIGNTARAAAVSMYDYGPESGVEQRPRPLTPEQLTVIKLNEVRQAGDNVYSLRQNALKDAA